MNYKLATRNPNMANSRSAAVRKYARCDIRDGILTTNTWGYYASRGGTRMLVVECKLDERIHINDTIEIILLEVGNEEARLGVESSAKQDNFIEG